MAGSLAARKRAVRAAVVLSIVAAADGCITDRAPAVPMDSLVEAASRTDAPCLVLFLPGRRDRLGAFERHGFPSAARRAGLTPEFVEADAHLGYYREGTVVARLAEDVVSPALARGTRRVWIVGISMGGLGAIAYAKERPEHVRGLVLLAPYLGEEDTIREVAASGLAAWHPGPGRAGDRSGDLWRWLRTHTTVRTAGSPEIYVGYGTKDDLAPADRLLADVLPAGHVFTTDGRHTWSAWKRLWRAFLGSGALQRDCGTAG